jgi:hypothetical protein
MIRNQVPKSFHNDGTRTLEWPYGSKACLDISRVSPIFTDCDYFGPLAFNSRGQEIHCSSGWYLYCLLREAAWQAINTNTYMQSWVELPEEIRNDWNRFAEETAEKIKKSAASRRVL